ncbi:MAG: aa3-type cytochrome c oxidase subunit IV [Thalassospira sp.]|jgi:hypothetical protein|nr:aa3-type cytochrome c oxidase subunit IV [Thalassospira sp.]
MADNNTILAEREQTWGRFLKWVVYGTAVIALISIFIIGLILYNTGAAA